MGHIYEPDRICQPRFLVSVYDLYVEDVWQFQLQSVFTFVRFRNQSVSPNIDINHSGN